MQLNDARPEGVNNILFQQKNNLVYCKDIYFLNNHFFCTQKYSEAFDNVFQQTIGKPFKTSFVLPKALLFIKQLIKILKSNILERLLK